MQQAPQKKMDRQKKEDDELEVARQKNIEDFPSLVVGLGRHHLAFGIFRMN